MFDLHDYQECHINIGKITKNAFNCFDNLDLSQGKELILINEASAVRHKLLANIETLKRRDANCIRSCEDSKKKFKSFFFVNDNDVTLDCI